MRQSDMFIFTIPTSPFGSADSPSHQSSIVQYPIDQYRTRYLIQMGNSEQPSYPTLPRDFQIQKYLNQGLNQNQIIQIKYAFDSYEPQDGLIDLNKLKLATQQSESKEKIDKYLGKKQQMNFDQFFAMSKEVLQQQIKKHPQLVIDKDEIEASCFFCPYAVDKRG